jgi:Lipid A 3-O-deacylase (PagL)
MSGFEEVMGPRLSRCVSAPALMCITTLTTFPLRAASAEGDCCNVLLGVGTTFSTFAWTGGLVLPVTFELEDSRWELGAFRFATAQSAAGSALPPSTHTANPYWGFTAMRRWQILHRPWGKLYLGFGANYRTEVDYLESTRWNFAYLVATRFGLGAHNRTLELGVRHWSDAWIRPPNRGQNFFTLSVEF